MLYLNESDSKWSPALSRCSKFGLSRTLKWTSCSTGTGDILIITLLKTGLSIKGWGGSSQTTGSKVTWPWERTTHPGVNVVMFVVARQPQLSAWACSSACLQCEETRTHLHTDTPTLSTYCSFHKHTDLYMTHTEVYINCVFPTLTGHVHKMHWTLILEEIWGGRREEEEQERDTSINIRTAETFHRFNFRNQNNQGGEWFVHLITEKMITGLKRRGINDTRCFGSFSSFWLTTDWGGFLLYLVF